MSLNTGSFENREYNYVLRFRSETCILRVINNRILTTIILKVVVEVVLQLTNKRNKNRSKKILLIVRSSSVNVSNYG